MNSFFNRFESFQAFLRIVLYLTNDLIYECIRITNIGVCHWCSFSFFCILFSFIFYYFYYCEFGCEDKTEKCKEICG